MMKHYKAPNGDVYAYELDGSQDHLIPNDFVVMAQEEIDARKAKFAEETAQAVAIRESALAKLAALGLTQDEVKALIG
jgi:hypothetical protein